MTRYFLGADGGGTTTDLTVVADDGGVLARHSAASTYYFSAGIDLVTDVLTEGVRDVCAAAGVSPDDITHAFFGLPSYGEVSGDVAALDRAPGPALGHGRYACDNDMVCGWAGSLAAEDGINVISGTGSMSYGRHGDRAHRVGGWGELFGDEGSAYWIAREGLALASRMSDGREPEGPLLEVFRSALGLRADLDLVDIVLNRWHGDRNRVAGLAPHVDAAARAGDTRAEHILRSAGEQLARLVFAARRQLGWASDEVVVVSSSGGTFASDEVRASFRRTVTSGERHVDLRPPRFPPAIGAALYAARLHETPLHAAALGRLDRECARDTRSST